MNNWGNTNESLLLFISETQMVDISQTQPSANTESDHFSGQRYIQEHTFTYSKFQRPSVRIYPTSFDGSVLPGEIFE